EAAPLHAPLPGRVVEIIDQVSHRAVMERSIVLEVTGQPAPVEEMLPAPAEEIETAELLDRIRQAGVVSPGNKSTPLALELEPAPPLIEAPPADEAAAPQKERRIETLIVAGLDREPGLYTNRRLAIQPTSAVFAGLTALRRISGAGEVILAADRHLNQEAWAGVLDQEGVTLVERDNAAYPLTLSQALIHALTGRAVPMPDGHPRDVGLGFVRLETLHWAGLAAATGAPQTEKWLTVVQSMGSTYLIKVPLGTTAGHILKSLKIKPADGGKIIFGGRLTGFAIYDLDTPVTKEVDGLYVIDPARVRRYTQEACFNCGICVKICPALLIPGELSRYCEYNRFEEAFEKGLESCIECGLCAYVCPAKRPIVHFFRHAKVELAAQRAEEAAAEAALKEAQEAEEQLTNVAGEPAPAELTEGGEQQ
ncbi:MAG: 4Fe-4S dicluster domain-containing protein, partial [Deltaproteobacteria bacterium]|nr:4Fe-4S dicluster domain-containing protein [Deltaproteobacteria bacterium]